MTRLRWWNVVVGALCAGLVVPLALDEPTVLRLVVGTTGLAIVAVSWFALGRRATAIHPGWAATVLQIAVVVGAGLAVFGHPVLATVQAVGYPIIWITSPTRRRAIIASIALAVAVAAGGLAAFGPTVAGLVTIGLSAGLSLVFAIGMGLWITAIADESEARRALLAELEATQAALAAASRDAGAATERERFAREIHDTVAQNLTGLVMGLRRLGREVDGAASATVDDLESLAVEALAEARALVAATASPTLDDGAPAALRRLGERFGRETSIAVDVRIATDLPPIARDLEVVLVRIAQEALANTRKHAAASSVSVSLLPDGGARAVVLRVADDGIGFDHAVVGAGFGLAGMRERLSLVGGALDVRSGGDGTTVTAAVPIEEAP